MRGYFMQVKIYTLSYCPFCKKAKTILRDKNVSFDEIDVTDNENNFSNLLAKKYNIKGEVTFPQIIINGNRIGGCSDLERLIETKKFDELLKEE